MRGVVHRVVNRVVCGGAMRGVRHGAMRGVRHGAMRGVMHAWQSFGAHSCPSVQPVRGRPELQPVPG